MNERNLQFVVLEEGAMPSTVVTNLMPAWPTLLNHVRKKIVNPSFFLTVVTNKIQRT